MIQLLPNLSNGMLDKFGTGGVVNNSPSFFDLPKIFALMPQDGWFIAQWGQPQPVNVNNYVSNNPSTYDNLYGNAMYAWSQPGQTSAISLYQNTAALGGGDVVQIEDGSTQQAPQGQTDEADMFLSSPNIQASQSNLSNPINLSLNAKITKAITNFTSSATASEYATSGIVFSVFDIGFTLTYNGADGLPVYVGFVQIVPWQSSTTKNANYESAAVQPNVSSTFISSLLLGSGTGLPLLSSDGNATPDKLTYSINQYAYQALKAQAGNLSASQKSAFLNLANWSVGGFYFGLATNNVPQGSSTSGTPITDVAYLDSIMQVSNISLSKNPNATYNSTSPSPIPTTLDINPQISFVDVTMKTSGMADGAKYIGISQGIQYEYIYTGNDNINLTAPTSGNWYFGGGNGQTNLTAISGNNIFLASSIGSIMTGGSGNDTFIIPTTSVTTKKIQNAISNFHEGDTVTIQGVGGNGWTYTWVPGLGPDSYTGLTLVAMNTNSPGLSEQLTFSGLNINDLSHFALSIGTSGDNLSITSTTSATLPVMLFNNFSNNQAGYMLGSFSSNSLISSGGIQEKFLYSGSNTVAMYAPAGENVAFGGGLGLTILSANSGDNVFVASSGSSYLIGGTGNDLFDVPDANLTGISTWDIIQNFHAGDSVSLAGVGGAGWKYSWLVPPNSTGIQNLTLRATSVIDPGLNEYVSFVGLTMNNLCSISLTSSSVNGDLAVTNNLTGSQQTIQIAPPSFDMTKGGSIIGKLDPTIVQDLTLFTGPAKMNFLTSTGEGSLQLNGESSVMNTSRLLGVNTVFASYGGTLMTGLLGSNSFFVPDASRVGISVWDAITNFHPGDNVFLTGLLMPNWTYQFSTQNQGTSQFSGLTLDASSTTIPGLTMRLTFANLQNTDLPSVSMSAGTGAYTGSLILSMH